MSLAIVNCRPEITVYNAVNEIRKLMGGAPADHPFVIRCLSELTMPREPFRRALRSRLWRNCSELSFLLA